MGNKPTLAFQKDRSEIRDEVIFRLYFTKIAASLHQWFIKGRSETRSKQPSRSSLQKSIYASTSLITHWISNDHPNSTGTSRSNLKEIG